MADAVNTTKAEEMKDPRDEALDAILDEAERLLALDLSELPEEVETGLDLIVSIARYKTDIRTDAEKNASSERGSE